MLDTPFFWAALYLLGAVIVCVAWFSADPAIADRGGLTFVALAWPLIVLCLPLIIVGQIMFHIIDRPGRIG